MDKNRVVVFLGAVMLSGTVFAGPPGNQRHEVLSRTHVHRAVLDRSQEDGGVSGACDPLVEAHTSSDFGPGEYIAQAGFVAGEIAATTYVLPESAFPVRIDLVEMMFATSGATVTTTTEWAVHIWEGTPANAFGDYAFYSDGKLLPHAIMPPGTTGLQLQFQVDPADPEQIWLSDDGSHSITIGFEIVSHNNQSGNGCLTPPSPNSNAFPTTDVDGLSTAAGNWIYVYECGIFGCPSGWKRFMDLPSICRPSGDWVQRVTVTPSVCDSLGGCCVAGECLVLDAADCAEADGVFQGAGTSCAGVDCTENVPCCFATTGGCVELDIFDCEAAGGVPGPIGQTCADTVCFPVGACCLPDGSCSDGLSPEDCAKLSGEFQGDGTDCAGPDCPEPMGAACFPTGFCLLLTEADAISAGADWKGVGTNCDDGDGNGTADACEDSGIQGDLNGDGKVDGADLGIFLSGWNLPGPTDLNGDGTTDGEDLGLLLINWDL